MVALQQKESSAAMDYSFWITVIGSTASIGSMIVSIYQARSARISSSKAHAAMTKVQLAAVVERLKTAQNHIRAIAPERVGQRGIKPFLIVDELRREFDTALSSLPVAGPVSRARKMLWDAQNCLNAYNTSFKTEVNHEDWQNLQGYVQDAMSDLSAQATTLGENNE